MEYDDVTWKPIISILLRYMCAMHLDQASFLVMFKHNSENIWTLIHASFTFYMSSYCSLKVLLKWISHSDSQVVILAHSWLSYSLRLNTAVKRSRTPIRTRDLTYLPHCPLLQQIRMNLKSDNYINVLGQLAAKHWTGLR